MKKKPDQIKKEVQQIEALKTKTIEDIKRELNIDDTFLSIILNYKNRHAFATSSKRQTIENAIEILYYLIKASK